MAALFRLVGPEGSPIAEADSLDAIIEQAKAVPPGRYRREQITRDPDTGDARPGDWGEVIRDDDGAVLLDLPPWLH
jgi:hypothetical protein